MANGSTVDLDGSRQTISETSGNIASVGTFDAVEGQTSVACTAPGEIRFFVDDESDVKRLGTIGLIVGFILMAIGAGLILLGLFVRKKVVPPAYG